MLPSALRAAGGVFYHAGSEKLMAVAAVQLSCVRILLVQDLHFRRQAFDWVRQQAPRFDAVCLPGDFLDAFRDSRISLKSQADWVLSWFSRFPVDGTRLLAATGNHDWWPGDDAGAEGKWLQRARRPGVAVDGDLVRTGGLSFACVAWGQPVNVPMSGPVVLVAHAPPSGTDVAHDRSDWGDPELGFIAESLPSGSIIVCGHVHAPRRWFARVSGSGTLCLNPGCNLGAGIPNHVVVDTGRRSAALVVAGNAIHTIRL